MFFISLLLSLSTLISAQFNSTGGQEPEKLNICREICKDLRSRSYMEYFPSSNRKIIDSSNEIDDLDSALCTLDYNLELEYEKKSFSSKRNVMFVDLSDCRIKFLNYIKYKYLERFQNAVNKIHIGDYLQFEDNVRNSASYKYEEDLLNLQKKYNCPPCEELLHPETNKKGSQNLNIIVASN